MSAQYTSRVDAVIYSTDPSVSHLEKADWIGVAAAALDQAGVMPQTFAEACTRAARTSSRTGTWEEYIQVVCKELLGS